jgi:hypothetical protein
MHIDQTSPSIEWDKELLLSSSTRRNKVPILRSIKKPFMLLSVKQQSNQASTHFFWRATLVVGGGGGMSAGEKLDAVACCEVEEEDCAKEAKADCLWATS